MIINDILDFSVIESGKLSFEKIGFDVVYQAKSVIESLLLQAQEKGLEIELVTDEDLRNIVLLGDPVRLNQILINLINNSIKFTNEGKITLKIDSNKAMDNFVNVTFNVIDTGIGIAKEKVKSIFKTFIQADDSITRKFGGTGLGLTISKQLVELQNGKISVESTPGIGTTFTFVIPYPKGRKKDILTNDISDGTTFDPTKEARSLKGMQVLLVEDNDINRMYASTILRKWGCKVDEAENGQIALEKVRLHDYSIILMDIHMPILDGIEASRSIRTTMPNPKNETPIIAFTANALKGDKHKYLDVGMNAYISKPFMPEELYKILTEFYNPIVNGDDENTLTPSIVDLSTLRKMSNNDEKFVRDMIESFITNTPEILEQIDKANNDRDWHEVSAMAHKLKPNLAFMGVDSLKDTVIQIEQSAKNKTDLEALPNKIGHLIEQVSLAIEELNETITSN